MVAAATGIETLAVKMGALALGTAAGPGEPAAEDEVQRLREELDAYVDALVEVEEDLRRALPPESG